MLEAAPQATETQTTGISRFVRACLGHPTDRTPVWFLRQAGRYMPEYMAVRKHHSLLDICRTPQIAAEVTITAAERLGVDAAIIFADLLLPFTPMGLDFEFVNGEGPVVHQPIRTLEQIQALRTDQTDDLRYVAQAIEIVGKHFNAPRSDGDQLGIIGFVGAPFTLASYMIEGGGSRNYIEAKKLMYSNSAAWPLLMEKLVTVLTDYAAQQVEAGADVIQVFDSWAGALSVADYRAYCLAPTTELIRRIQAMGVPVIYFGVDTASPPAHLPRDRRRRPRPRLAHPTRRSPPNPRRGPEGRRHRRPGQPRPHHPLRPRRRPRSPRQRDPHAQRQPPRPHLQPRPRHRPRHTRRGRDTSRQYR